MKYQTLIQQNKCLQTIQQLLIIEKEFQQIINQRNILLDDLNHYYRQKVQLLQGKNDESLLDINDKTIGIIAMKSELTLKNILSQLKKQQLLIKSLIDINKTCANNKLIKNSASSEVTCVITNITLIESILPKQEQVLGWINILIIYYQSDVDQKLELILNFDYNGINDWSSFNKFSKKMEEVRVALEKVGVIQEMEEYVQLSFEAIGYLKNN
ncbi:hypothetical protein K502DRAFT_324803 [Neoconidiobolus thromboides FSU 785]|nr:hypothetical protein K502DRAFT_324803 [Neoconidiobolus thromboides FSU 785]